LGGQLAGNPHRYRGLIVGPTIAYERMGEVLGINPRWAAKRMR
jgi:hypothetical protein